MELVRVTVVVEVVEVVEVVVDEETVGEVVVEVLDGRASVKITPLFLFAPHEPRFRLLPSLVYPLTMQEGATSSVFMTDIEVPLLKSACEP